MLLNWVYMQREIGVSKIKMCLFNINKRQQDMIIKHFGDFVQIINHKTKMNQVCQYQLAKYTENSNNTTGALKFILDNCKNLFNVHFRMSHYATFQHQQMICTQGYYSSF